MMALKAAEEPRKMQPKIITRMVVKIKEARGTWSRRGMTRAKSRE